MTQKTPLGVTLAAALALAATACDGSPPSEVAVDVGPPHTAAHPTAQPVQPLLVAEAPQISPPRSPEPLPDLPCGSVDRLDFPLGPPDGEGFGARWIFGRNSRRYRQIHAGEDWTSLTGASLGTPVHAIGHGVVTYANPYGWGATDKGVVIVRHRLPDGADRLSLYGHLEPSSVTIKKGACVARGDIVGRVGKPRGAPHLHFEIRTHLPDQPGPGYWPTDPTRAGWDPPSETILTWRDRLHPAVTGVLPMTNAVAIGTLGMDVLLAHEGDVVALAVGAGTEAAHATGTGSPAESWRITRSGLSSGSPGSAVTDESPSASMRGDAESPVLDPSRGLLYITHHVPAGDGSTANTGVALSAVRVPPDGSAPLWTSELPGEIRVAVPGTPESGGAVILGEGWMRRYEPDGAFVVSSVPDTSTSILVVGGRTVLSQEGTDEAWVIDADGAVRGPLLPGGVPAIAGAGRLWLLRPEGLYLTDLATLRARRVVSLEPGPFRSGAIAGLSDGGALALRRGEESWELVRALPGGSVGWRRRLDRSEVQPPALLLAGGVPYVVTRGGNVLAVDTGSGNATLVYRAGRTVARARASSAGDRIVLEAGGAYSIAMDPRGTRPPAVLD